MPLVLLLPCLRGYMFYKTNICQENKKYEITRPRLLKTCVQGTQNKIVQTLALFKNLKAFSSVSLPRLFKLTPPRGHMFLIEMYRIFLNPSLCLRLFLTLSVCKMFEIDFLTKFHKKKLPEAIKLTLSKSNLKHCLIDLFK